MLRRVLPLALASALAAGLSGCASIVSNSQYPVTVTSDPVGVFVTVRDEDGAIIHRDTTPFTVTLRTYNGWFDGMDYTLESEHGGTRELNACLDPWYAGNLLFGGLLGLIVVDPLTGSMWKYPATVSVPTGGQ